MENKTAIIELMEIVDMDYNNGVEISMKVFYGMLKKALEAEKRQIIEAYEAGQMKEAKEPVWTKGNLYYATKYQKD